MTQRSTSEQVLERPPRVATEEPDPEPTRQPALGAWSARRLSLLAALLGVLLTLPALWTGFAQDDYFFLMVFKGAPGLDFLDISPTETFSFSKGDPASHQAMIEHGYLPWWAAEGWKINFWRPLSSLSSWLDYRLFGESPWPMHLHSVLLYGVLILIATRLYRNLHAPAGAVFLATLIFAVDSGHAIPVAWLSMRNAIMALLFGLLALHAHDRWRQGGSWLPHGPLALLWLVLALLSGESAVAVGGYLLAYALFLDPAAASRSGKSRMAGYVKSVAVLLPYLVVVVLWRGIYSSMGYGTEGSGLYTDPIAEPTVFLVQLPARLAVLLLGLFAFPDAGLWSLAPSWFALSLLGAAVVFLIIGGCLVRPLLRDCPQARFYLLGAVLAAVPACATLPMDRNMMFSSFGAAALVALYITRVWARPSCGGAVLVASRFPRGFALLLVVAHLVIAPFALMAGTQQLNIMNQFLMESNPSIPTTLPKDTRIVALNLPSDLLGTSLPIFRSAMEEVPPGHWWWLYAGVDALSVERTAPNTLVLRPEGSFLSPAWSETFRSPVTHPFQAADEVYLAGLTIRVLAVTPEGSPTEVQFEFDRPLEDPTLYVVSWQNGRYVPFTVPPPGEIALISGPQFQSMLPTAH